METYSDRLTSIPGRLFRWTLKVLVVNAAIVGASGYALHRAAPIRTTAAWNAFWAKPAPESCAVPATASKGSLPSLAETGVPASAGVVVYGRDACGITRAMRRSLDAAGIPYRYAVVDEPAVSSEVNSRLRSIGHSGGYGLPVVAVGGTVHIRPSPEEVARLYKKG